MLGRAEIELAADHGERGLLGNLDRSAELARQVGEHVEVGGDADLLKTRQHADQGQLDVGEQAGGAALAEVAVEGRREVEHGLSAHDLVDRVAVFVEAVERELRLRRRAASSARSSRCR